jgi:hypothetical protein
MALKRFKNKPFKDQVIELLSTLGNALNSSDKESRKKWKTSVYGIAKQYGRFYGITHADDYDLIKDMTVREIVGIVMDEDESNAGKIDMLQLLKDCRYPIKLVHVSNHVETELLERIDDAIEKLS